MALNVRIETRKYFTILSFCLNVILLLVIDRQSFCDLRVSSVQHSVPLNQRPEPVPDNARPSATVINESHSAIRSTKESLYVMYGDGDFSEYNEHLLNYIRSKMSRPEHGGRNLLSEPSKVDFSQEGGSQYVDRLLEHRQNGFFVECGAFNGEQYSDTLFFEIERNWTGLLIESHPEYHRDILKKNRQAVVLRGCLSSSRRPGLLKYRLAGWSSGISALNKNVNQYDKAVPETDVQCFSLNSIMTAIGVHHIDFMVLDVEGSELPVLETIDFTRLSVDVFSIEYSDYTGPDQVSKLKNIRNFFSRTGRYKEVGKLPLGAKDDTAQDVIFMRV